MKMYVLYIESSSNTDIELFSKKGYIREITTDHQGLPVMHVTNNAAEAEKHFSRAKALQIKNDLLASVKKVNDLNSMFMGEETVVLNLDVTIKNKHFTRAEIQEQNKTLY